MSKPVLSIITVCFQASEAVRATLNNVLLQSYLSFEYLVVDGGSSDDTEELLSRYQTLFSDRGILFRFVSEPDRGIYDAMNKGVKMARGKWLLFLNAGDLLCAADTLEQAFRHHIDAQILYGDTLGVYQGNTRHYPALPLNHITYEMPFCHQSAFIRRELLTASPYDITYRVCADHHFFLSMYLQKKKFAYCPLLISVYEIAGYSDQNKLHSHREKHRMQKELGIFHLSFAWMIREFVFYIKYGIRRLFGQQLVDFIRKKRSCRTL